MADQETTEFSKTLCQYHKQIVGLRISKMSLGIKQGCCMPRLSELINMKHLKLATHDLFLKKLIYLVLYLLYKANE